MSDNITVYWVSKELAADDGDAAGDEERDRPLVEEFEGEVIYGDLREREDRSSGFLLHRLPDSPAVRGRRSIVLLHTQYRHCGRRGPY